MKNAKLTVLAGNPPPAPVFSKLLRSSSGEELYLTDPKMIRLLVALMDMQAVIGGAASHWGGPSAFAEIFSVLHGLVFSEADRKNEKWSELFHLVNDAGHCENAIYAVKALYGFAGLNIESLKGFRSIKSPLAGHGEAHLFPEGVFISNGPLGSGLPQAQGLAMGDRALGNKRMTIVTISDGACMEGEAREALAAIPGLAARDLVNPFVLVISDNNTKLNGRIDEESFSMAPSFASLSSLGWDVIKVEQGNDLEAVLAGLERAFTKASEHRSRPVAVHVKTVKGFGVKKTAESSSGGHGFPLKDATSLRDFLNEIWGEQKVSWLDEIEIWLKELEATSAKKESRATLIKKVKVQVGVSKAMIQAKKNGLPIISISADLPGSTGVGAFRAEFADVTFDVGVAESNMISAAAGFSKLGFLPVVDTFAQFGVTKGALPLTMAALSQAPIFCIFSHAGFQDAADGASHQALSYIAQVASIPDVDCYILSTSDEAESLLAQAFQHFQAERAAGLVPRSQVFFLGREEFVETVEAVSKPMLGKAQLVKDAIDSAAVIVAAGPLLHEALAAAQELENSGISVIVINPSIINRPDVELIGSALLRSQNRLLTVEDHQSIGGMGSLLSHQLLLSGYNFRLKSLAVSGVFGRSAYAAQELYAKHALTSQSITEAVKKLISH